MTFSSVICLLLTYGAAAWHKSEKPGRGATLAATRDSLDRGLAVLAPMFIDHLAKTPIPDQTVGTGLFIRDISVAVGQNMTTELKLLKDENAAELIMSGLSLKANCTVQYLLAFCPGVGHTSGAELDLTVGVNIRDGALNFTLKNISIDVGDFGLDLDGPMCGLLHRVASWFLNEEDVLRQALEVMTERFTESLDEFLHGMSYQVPTTQLGFGPPLDQAVADFHWIDAQVAEELGTGEPYLLFGQTGDFRDAATPQQSVPVEASELPDLGHEHLLKRTLSACIGNYSILTAMYIFQQQGALKFELDAGTATGDVQAALSTDAAVWKSLQIDWGSLFDSPKNMSLLMQPAGLPQVVISKQSIAYTSEFDFIFTVDGATSPMTAVAFRCPMHLAVDVYTNATTGPFALVPEVHDVDCVLSTLSSAVKISDESLQLLNSQVAPDWIRRATAGFNELTGGGLAFPATTVHSPAGLVALSFRDGLAELDDDAIRLYVDYSYELQPNTPASRPLMSRSEAVIASFRAVLARLLSHEAAPASAEMLV